MAGLAAVPLGIGMLQMFGLLGWLDIPLNPANLIALPLILGIGVDYGVHIVHEFRETRGPYRMSPGTAVAVLVDALTTLVGFGSLMIATHQGLQSLGRVLTLGVTCCLFTSLVMLPAALTWFTRNRKAPLPMEPRVLIEPRAAVAFAESNRTCREVPKSRCAALRGASTSEVAQTNFRSADCLALFGGLPLAIVGQHAGRIFFEQILQPPQQTK